MDYRIVFIVRMKSFSYMAIPYSLLWRILKYSIFIEYLSALLNYHLFSWLCKRNLIYPIHSPSCLWHWQLDHRTLYCLQNIDDKRIKKKDILFYELIKYFTHKNFLKTICCCNWISSNFLSRYTKFILLFSSFVVFCYFYMCGMLDKQCLF